LRPADELQEQAFILQNVKELLQSGVKAEEIAILSRTNAEADAWSTLLEEHGIECESRSTGNILESPFVALVLNIFELLNDPYGRDSDMIDLLRSGCVSGIDRVDVLRINRTISSQNYGKTEKIGIFEGLQNENLLNRDTLKNAAALDDFVAMVYDLQKSRTLQGFYAYFKEVIEKFRVVEFIQKYGNFSDIENIYTLMETAKDWGRTYDDFHITQFLRKMEVYKRYRLIIKPRVVSKRNG